MCIAKESTALVLAFLSFTTSRLAAVEILGVEPRTVPREGGVEVTITGRDFAATHVARLGGTPLERQVFAEGRDTQSFHGLSPAFRETGPHDAEIWNPRTGEVIASLPGAVEVTGPGPARVEITGIEPREVSARGGTMILIHGVNLAEDHEFNVDDVPVVVLEILDSRRAVGVAPALAEGPHEFTVHDASGAVLDALDTPVTSIASDRLVRCVFEGVDVIHQKTPTGEVPQLNAGRVDQIDVLVPAGVVGRSTSYVALSSNLEGMGVQAWSLSAAVTGDLVLEEADVEGTAGATADYQFTAVVDPTKLHPLTGQPQGQGFVSVAVLDFNFVDTLPPTGTTTVLRVEVAASKPMAGEELKGRIDWQEAMVGPFGPVRNRFTSLKHPFHFCRRRGLDVSFLPNAELIGIDPSLISTSGDTRVTFRGKGFAPGMEFQIGGLSIGRLEFIDDRTAQGIARALGEGSHHASVLLGRDTLDSLDDVVEAAPPPVVDSVEPLEVTEGTPVTVRGRNLRPETKVFFGHYALLDAEVSRDGTTLTGRAPEFDVEGPTVVTYGDPRGEGPRDGGVVYVDPDLLEPPERLFALVGNYIKTSDIEVLMISTLAIDIIDLQTFDSVKKFTLTGLPSAYQTFMDLLFGDEDGGNTISSLNAFSIEVSRKGHRVYVVAADDFPDQIEVYRSLTGELLSEIAFPGEQVADCQLSEEDEKRLFVSASKSLAAVDTKTGQVVEKKELSSSHWLSALALSLDGATLGCLGWGNSAGSRLYLVDPASLDVQHTISIPNPADFALGHDLAFTENGRVLVWDRFWADLRQFDVATGAYLPEETIATPQIDPQYDGQGALQENANLLVYSPATGQAFTPSVDRKILRLDPGTLDHDTFDFDFLTGEVPTVSCLRPDGEELFTAMGFPVTDPPNPIQQTFYLTGYETVSGAIHNNVYQFGTSTVVIDLRATGPGPKSLAEQLAGDINLDFRLDISDPVKLLGFLFLGNPARLPCGDGRSGDPANLALLDANGDGTINIADPTYVLTFLFAGGRPPVAGTQPITVPGCPGAGVRG